MILTDSEAPRWIRELARFVHLKSLLLVHGNVLDMVSYPVQTGKEGRRYWTESSLRGFFQRYLQGLGYEVVGAFDPVDGLDLADAAMEPLFERLANDQGAEGEGGWGRPTAGARSPGTGRAGRSRCPGKRWPA